VLKKPVRIEYGTNQKRNEDAVQTTSGKEEEAADEEGLLNIVSAFVVLLPGFYLHR
jgi:hypothetical protein